VLPKAAPPKIQESEVKEIPETPPDDDGSTRVPVNEEAKSSPSVRKHKKLILYGKSVKKVRVPSLEY
jgi:hypothetical protein